MRFSLNSAVLIGAGLLLAALVSSAAISYRNLRQLQIDYEWVSHTYEVQTSLAELSSSMTEIRALMLLPTAEKLEKCQHALDRVVAQHANLVKLTADNPQQQERLARLSESLEQAGTAIAGYQRQWDDRSQRRELERGIQQRLISVREGLEEMGEAENRLLADRTHAAESAHKYRFVSWLVLLALSTLLLLGVAHMIHLADNRQQEASLAVAREAQRREDQLRQLADAVPQIVWIAAADGQNEYFNRRWYDYTNCTSAECLGEGWINFLHPDDRERTAERWQESVSEAIPYEVEYRFRSAEGQYRWFLARGLPILDQHGAIRRWFGTCTDIHEIEQVREQLAASEDFLRCSLDALSSPIVVLDEQGTVLTINRAWSQFAELNGWHLPHHGVGSNYLEACRGGTSADDELPSSDELIRQVLEGKLQHGEVEYPSAAQGEQQWYLMRVARFNRTGAVRVVVSHENISDRVRAAREANLRTEQLRATAELAVHINAAEDTEGILLTLTDGVRRLIGAHFAATFEISAEEDCVACNRQSLSPSISAELPNELIENLARRAHDATAKRGAALLDGETLQEDIAWQHLSALAPTAFGGGGLIAVRLPGGNDRATTLLYLAGKKGQLVFNADDEAVLVQLAQLAAVAVQKTHLALEREHSNRRKDEFLATLAHELRNPLTSLYSAAQLLELEADQPENVRDYAAITQRRCEQLGRLIDDLLDVSRIATGKLQLKREIFAVQEAVTTALDMSQPLVVAANHQLVTDICAEPLTIEGDRARVAQIIANLLVNAAKYTPAGGQLAFAVQRGEESVKISVRDNGIGIAPEMLPHVFELFSQADTSNTRAQGGLGIGLTLVRTLVDMHGGHITAISAGLDQGSEFTVTLPLTSERVAPESPAPQPVSTNGRRARFLIVDDNRAAVYLLEKLLVRLGQTVAVANNGEEAIAKAPEFQPDIVFSDIAMPGMAGYELLPHLVEELAPHRPYFVALTGYGQELDRARSEEAGFDRHLVKPISIETLRELIASWAPQTVQIV
jgi:PAS domain S-box-containing protein